MSFFILRQQPLNICIPLDCSLWRGWLV